MKLLFQWKCKTFASPSRFLPVVIETNDSFNVIFRFWCFNDPQQIVVKSPIFHGHQVAKSSLAVWILLTISCHYFYTIEITNELARWWWKTNWLDWEDQWRQLKQLSSCLCKNVGIRKNIHVMSYERVFHFPDRVFFIFSNRILFFNERWIEELSE